MMLLPLLVALCIICVSHAQTINHKIGVKLCKVMCMERSSCERVAYEARTLTCQLLSKATRPRTEKGYIAFPKGKLFIDAGACSRKTCGSKTRCLENHGGRGVCIHDKPTSMLTKRCKRTKDCKKKNFQCVRRRCKCANGFIFKPADNTCIKDKSVSMLKKRCKRTKDCKKKNFRCLKRRCECAVGFNFNPSDNTCVKHCDKYGNRSTVHKTYLMIDPYFMEIDAASLSACLEICHNEESDLCVSFNFLSDMGLCCVSLSGWFDVAPDKRSKNRHSYFGARDCA